MRSTLLLSNKLFAGSDPRDYEGAVALEDCEPLAFLTALKLSQNRNAVILHRPYELAVPTLEAPCEQP